MARTLWFSLERRAVICGFLEDKIYHRLALRLIEVSMLLSMYASYRWARIDTRAYILRMVAFVVSVSFLSAYAPVGILIVMTFPFCFLSFPFYVFIDKVWFGEPHGWVSVKTIRLFTADLYSAPANWQLTSLQFMLSFSFLLCINVLGALVGFWAGRKWKSGFLESARWKIICALIGIGSLAMVFGLNAFSIDETVGVAVLGFGIFMVEIAILSQLLGARWR